MRDFSTERVKSGGACDQPSHVEKAMTTVEFLRLDRQAKMENQARQKYLLDQASLIAGARAEGIAEGKKEMARKLLALGMDITLITQASGLSEEEIKN
ncbi:hypothetical protein [Paenibacillus dendritiformis]|uniref:hypothetical protein n=1 Tax=Paenibacillus dendritiformis TaxID=130049 RepID=UPI00387E0D97